MWEKILDYGRQIFALTGKVQQHDASIESLQEDLEREAELHRNLQAEFAKLVLIVQKQSSEIERLKDTIRHERETADKDRQILLLQLKTAFLEQGKQLPPGIENDKTED